MPSISPAPQLDGARSGSGPVATLVANDGVVSIERRPRVALCPDGVRVAVTGSSLGYLQRGAPVDYELLGDTFVGTVVEVGPAADPSLLGARVIGLLRQGACASEVAVPAVGVHRCDNRQADDHVLVALGPGVVATCALHFAPTHPGAVALILSAGSAASFMMIGLLSRAGVTVIAARPDLDAEAAAVLRAAGASEVLSADRAPARAELHAVTGGRGADIVYDCSRRSPGPWPAIGELLVPGGRVIRTHHADLGNWDLERARSMSVVETMADVYGERVFDRSEPLRPAIERIGELLASGELVVPVQVFDAVDGQAAYDRFQAPSTLGRVVIRAVPEFD